MNDLGRFFRSRRLLLFGKKRRFDCLFEKSEKSPRLALAAQRGLSTLLMLETNLLPPERLLSNRLGATSGWATGHLPAGPLGT